MNHSEFAAALRSIANHINAVATAFETPAPTYIVTENGQRIRVAETKLLTVEPKVILP